MSGAVAAPARAEPVLMPKLGLTMTEATLAEWVAQQGVRHPAGEVIALIETDKVVHEITAPFDGCLGQVRVGQGEIAPVGAVLAQWYDGAPPEETGAEPAAPQPAPSPSAIAPAAAAAAGLAASPARIVATPLARRLARDHGVELATVAGTGPRGRIKAADVERSRAARPAREAAAGEALPLTGFARAMAGRVAAAKRDIPHFYLAIDVDATELERLRQALNAQFDRRTTLNHLVLAGVVSALGSHADMRRVWSGEGLLMRPSIDIGVAVDTERGLLNPVVRDLGGDDFFALADKVDAAVAKARTGRLELDDFEGGVLSVSNAGMFGVRYMTPIVVPGQGAILGIGAASDRFRPDEKGAPKLVREMGIVMSADHRVHTGAGVARFLDTLRRTLEQPLPLIMPNIRRESR